MHVFFNDLNLQDYTNNFETRTQGHVTRPYNIRYKLPEIFQENVNRGCATYRRTETLPVSQETHHKRAYRFPGPGSSKHKILPYFSPKGRS